MLDTAPALKRTPFHARHVALKARLVPFAGYEMPLQYEGIVAEHKAVRTGVGVFDVSHMGEIRLRGPDAVSFANRLVTAEVGAVPDGKAVYTPMCREDGGIIDDLLVYACGADRLLVVNAANFEKDLAWVRSRASARVEVLDESAATAQLAVQGPRSEDRVSSIYGDRVRSLEFYTGYEQGSGESWTLVSRTGYTGEDGFEIYVRAPRALEHWDRLFAALPSEPIRPIGLGARDTLRLEMGYCLYGNDIDESTNPIEAGLGWTVRFDKPEFIGRDALVRVRAEGPRRRLVGLVLDGERIARSRCGVLLDGTPVGTVTSGSMGISLGRPVALAYVATPAAKAGTRLTLSIPGAAPVSATVTSRPMYGAGSVRAPRPRRSE